MRISTLLMIRLIGERYSQRDMRGVAVDVKLSTESPCTLTDDGPAGMGRERGRDANHFHFEKDSGAAIPETNGNLRFRVVPVSPCDPRLDGGEEEQLRIG